MNNWIVDKIKEQGYKITPSRQQIFDWLISCNGLFCAKDILEQQPDLDKVSVYRTLELLEKNDIIRRSAVRDDQQFFELHKHEDHHHHIVCIECQKDACIPCVMPNSTPKIKGFSNIHHDIHFSGVCTKCR